MRVARGSFPSKRINVVLELHGAVVATTYADAEGKFLFRDLVANLYYVVVNDEDYEPVRIMVPLNPSNTGTGFLQITLNVKAESPKSSSSASNAGTNPYVVNLGEYTKKFPKEAIKEFERGVKSANKRKLDEAVKHYQKSLQLAPDYYPARNNLGLLYLSKGDYEKASDQLQQALRLNPADSEAWFNLGNLYLQTKQYPEAVHGIREGLNRRPDSALGHFLLGSVYEVTGQYKESETALRDALRLDPHMSHAYLQLVNLYLQQQKTTAAIAELRQFLKNFRNDPLAPKAAEVLKRLETNLPRGPG